MPSSVLPAPGSIDIRTLENASQAVYQADPAGLGLRLATAPGGQPAELETADGCTADVYLDGAGNVIVAYQGTTTAPQLALDQAVLEGTPVAQLAGFSQAAAIARAVRADAAADGIPAARIYLTGFSLGGTLAQYAALQTGLAGASFAGFGMPGYASPGGPSSFVSFVDRGDPYANAATDTAEAAQARVIATHADHDGEVALLGTPGDSRTLMTFISALDATGLDLRTHLFQAIGAVQPQYDAAAANHVLAKYDADIATRYGAATLAQIAALEAPSALRAPRGLAVAAAPADVGAHAVGASAGVAAALWSPAAAGLLYHQP